MAKGKEIAEDAVVEVKEEQVEATEEKKEPSLKDLLRELIKEELQSDTDPAKVESRVLQKVEKTEEQKKQEEWLNELVPFKAFKDGDKYKGDIFVSHNETTYQIKRGVEVMIPRKVYLILERSERQKDMASDLVDELEENFNQSVEAGRL